MYPRTDLPRSLTSLATRQDGLLTLAQVLAELGRTPLRRLVGTGTWSRLTPGIYLTTPGPPAPLQRLRAGHLLGGPGAPLGGLAALHLAGICEPPGEVDVWVPAHRGRVDRPGWRFREDGWGRLDHTVGSLPRIRAEEALIDAGQALDVEGWVTLVAEAARLDQVSLPRVLEHIDRRPRVSNRAMLREVVCDLGGIESTLEWVYRRDVERAHGLPTALRQVTVMDGARCDVRYGAHRLIVELDGRIHLRRVFRDLERDNEHALRAETTLRYGSVDVRGRPCRVAWQVGRALGVRGWRGAVRPCPRCEDGLGAA